MSGSQTKGFDVPDELLEKCEQAVDEGGYQNFSEFVRDAVRRRAEEVTGRHSRHPVAEDGTPTATAEQGNVVEH